MWRRFTGHLRLCIADLENRPGIERNTRETYDQKDELLYDHK
jgi:hypothetical protein